MKSNLKIIPAILFLMLLVDSLQSQNLIENPQLDKIVKDFLDKNSGRWHDMNVPTSDGKKLYQIIIDNKYKSALEIGTSTGYSSIWIAWALSKTGGKLITIEIDESRHKKALQNFIEAGLLDYIDARLADAHELVKKLNGPFDFVFSDADKNWYLNYFKDINAKLVAKGCFVSHNVSENHYSQTSPGYLEYLKKLPDYETTVFDEGAGMSISYKKAVKK